MPPLVPPAEPISRRRTIDAKVPSRDEAAFAITVPSADELARRPVVARPPTEVVANVDVDRLQGNPNAPFGDRVAAQSILDDLRSAMGGGP